MYRPSTTASGHALPRQQQAAPAASPSQGSPRPGCHRVVVRNSYTRRIADQFELHAPGRQEIDQVRPFGGPLHRSRVTLHRDPMRFQVSDRSADVLDVEGQAMSARIAAPRRRRACAFQLILYSKISKLAPALHRNMRSFRMTARRSTPRCIYIQSSSDWKGPTS
jgi:hypothetical protein